MNTANEKQKRIGSPFKGVVYFQNKNFVKIYSPHVIQDVHVFFSFSRKESKVFEESIPGFFSIKWTSVGANGLKVQSAVSVQLQRALHDPSWEIRVLQYLAKRSVIFKKMLYFLTTNAHLDLAMHIFDFTHCVITLERSRMVSSSSVYFGSER